MADQVDKNLLGTREVARITGLSVGHIRRLLIEDEKLHGRQLDGWTWMVDRAEVERFRREWLQRERKRKRPR